MEKGGLVNRGRLLNIRGRSRERQLELAEKYGLDGYATPAGGCLLTDPEFSDRLLKMLEYWPDCGRNDIELLKYGRIFWLKEKSADNAARAVLLVVGRDERDNGNLEKLAQKGDIMVELKEETGPTSLISGLETGDAKPVLEMDIPEKITLSKLKLDEAQMAGEIIDISALLTGYYAVKARGRRVKLGAVKES
jgi:tRNA-specific 2-thiouridylase